MVRYWEDKMMTSELGRSGSEKSEGETVRTWSCWRLVRVGVSGWVVNKSRLLVWATLSTG